MRSQKCQCGGCKLWFTSVSAFDKHRKGAHEDLSRFCLKTDIGLEAAGLRKVFKGRNKILFWTNSKPIPQEKIKKLREKAKQKAS